LEPDGFRHSSVKAGKSVLFSEVRQLARPGRCLIVYHHHTRRKGGHHSEIEHCADRLRRIGFTTVDALRAKPYSPRVFFLLDAPADVRQRAAQIEANWQSWITWHPDKAMADRGGLIPTSGPQPARTASDAPPTPASTPADRHTPLSSVPNKSGRRRSAGTTQVGYV